MCDYALSWDMIVRLESRVPSAAEARMGEGRTGDSYALPPALTPNAP
jgi:hypothetical protein